MRKIEGLNLLQFWDVQQPAEFSKFLKKNSQGSDTFENQR